MAFKAINDIASLGGLVPTLLVFRAYLWIVKLDTLSPSVIQRAMAIKKVIVEIQKLYRQNVVLFQWAKLLVVDVPCAQPAQLTGHWLTWRTSLCRVLLTRSLRATCAIGNLPAIYLLLIKILKSLKFSSIIVLYYIIRL
jgi:hypothetical protein